MENFWGDNGIIYCWVVVGKWAVDFGFEILGVKFNGFQVKIL
jgi:hypothetical protein